MEPKPAVTFVELVRAAKLRQPAPLDRAELAPDQFRSVCEVCRTVTVHQVINVAGKLTTICTECNA